MPLLLLLLAFALTTSTHAYYTTEDVAERQRQKEDAMLGPRGCCCSPGRNLELLRRSSCEEKGTYIPLPGFEAPPSSRDFEGWEEWWNERFDRCGRLCERVWNPDAGEIVVPPLPSLPPPPPAPVRTSPSGPREKLPPFVFSDVPKNYPYAAAIAYVKDEGIVSGYPDGTFRPERLINRAEFTKIIVESQFSQSDIEQCDTGTVGFSDVSPRAWYTTYVCLAKEKGIISGYPDGTFKPAAPINFVEAAKVLVNAFGFEASTQTGGHYNEYGTWMEGDRPWYWPYVDVLEKKNAIPTTFWWVDEHVSRAQMAEMIERLRERITDRASLAYKNIGPVYGERYTSEPPPHTDIIRVHADLTKPLPSSAYLTEEIFEMMSGPGWFRIEDVPISKQDDQNTCHRFNTSGLPPFLVYPREPYGTMVTSLVYSKEERDGLPVEITLTLNTTGDHYCIFPHDGLEPYECPEGVTDRDDPSCNFSRAEGRVYTLKKRGGDFWIEGAKNDRLLITYEHFDPVTYDEAKCRAQYGHDVGKDVCPPGKLELTRVDATGTVETQIRPSDGKTIYIYRTPWQPVFRDLRGMSPLLLEKEIPGGYIYREYFGGGHNLGSPGKWKTSYENCLTQLAYPSTPTHQYEFCVTKEAGHLVIASTHEFVPHMTMWIDEHFVY